MRTLRSRPAARSRFAPAVAGRGLLPLLLLLLLLLVVGGGVAPAAATSPPTASLSSVVVPNLGPGYVVTSEGPLDPSRFASDSPDPAAAEGALSTLAKSNSTYERVWQAADGLNQVQDLLVRFPDAVGAQVFLQAAQHSLESGEIVSSDPVASIPGARRVTYFAATNGDGVGEAVTMRAGMYVDLLSFFSAAGGNAQPISPADAERVALAQHSAMVAAPGGVTAAATAPAKKGISAGTIGLAVLVVAVLAVALATPLVLRRRRAAEDPYGTGPVQADPSGGDVPEQLREESG